MTRTYLTCKELSALIKYNTRTIREQMIDSVLLEGRHYFRPFGGRKILFIWEHIEEDMSTQVSSSPHTTIPSAQAQTRMSDVRF